MRRSPQSFGWTDHNNDAVAFGVHRVGMSLIKLKNHSRYERTRAVLAGSHPAHSICMDWNIPDVVVASSVRKIEQNP
ncbi:MAG: hypothetical protein WA741_34960, partial [Candidatus Sulfotelmatobacter sp.]